MRHWKDAQTLLSFSHTSAPVSIIHITTYAHMDDISLFLLNPGVCKLEQQMTFLHVLLMARGRKTKQSFLPSVLLWQKRQPFHNINSIFRACVGRQSYHLVTLDYRLRLFILNHSNHCKKSNLLGTVFTRSLVLPTPTRNHDPREDQEAINLIELISHAWVWIQWIHCPLTHFQGTASTSYTQTVYTMYVLCTQLLQQLWEECHLLAYDQQTWTWEEQLTKLRASRLLTSLPPSLPLPPPLSSSTQTTHEMHYV